MGLFNRKKENEEYIVPEERLKEIVNNGISVEVAIGTHGADEIVAGSMIGTTGKLIAMGNYGKPKYVRTMLFINEEHIRFQLTGDTFQYTDIYSLEPRNVGMIHAEFVFITTSGEVLVKATNPDFLAIRELFIRFVALCEERMVAEENEMGKAEETTEAESDVDRLIQLAELHKQGLLTDEEFSKAKKKLL